MGVILDIADLRTFFDTPKGVVKAVDAVDVTLTQGDTLGIVGESGCGKTVLALSVMRLIPSPPGKIVSGRIRFKDVDLLRLKEEEMRRVRGRDISMIFQEPMTSLNPVFRIGDQVAEVIRLHQGLSGRDALHLAVEMMKLVGIAAPERRAREYPHQMSGGMRQRVMIAMAIACAPRLMLADEPTTALDVTIQAQILDLIGRLKEEIGTSVILITHDLGIVAEVAQSVAVMYAGRIVESGPSKEVFSTPLHPYTRGLTASIPKLHRSTVRQDVLPVIPGMVPPLYHLPEGCRFQDRCPEVMGVCRHQDPDLKRNAGVHAVRCWKYE
jgi:oligopeptide/dipeptide ABC transporter ATP-binding protein